MLHREKFGGRTMLYLMRHGLDDENYVGGWSDVGLVSKGID